MMGNELLEVVQNSEFKKEALLSQLLCQDSEEVEELVDDYGYEELVEREHDDELAEILGEELLVRWNAKYSYLQIQKKN